MTSSKPAVMMVTGAYVPELSGAGLQCRELVRQLCGSVNFRILTTTTDPALPLEDERDGVPVHRVFVDPSSLWSKCKAAWRMMRVIVRERRRFSILHLHGFSQKSVVVVLLGLVLEKRIAIKLTSVGHDDPASMRGRGRLVYWCYRRARVVFGVSPKLQALYEASKLPRDRFRLIPNGVDLERFRPASFDERLELRRALGLPLDGPLTLFVGFFSHEKCPDVLFDAWLRVVASRDRAGTLLFVGATRSGYYEVDERLAVDMRAQVSRLGLGERVLFVESTQVIEQYQRAADVFVLPSVREGLPNALLEAMACGLGCVATRLEGVTDSLLTDGESGLLVPPRDVTALASALARLLAEADGARTMGASARRRIERDFALSSTADQYLGAYRELLAS